MIWRAQLAAALSDLGAELYLDAFNVHMGAEMILAIDLPSMDEAHAVQAQGPAPIRVLA